MQYRDRVKFSGDSGYSGDSKIKIKFFVIGYPNIMFSTEVIKPSQKSFAFGYFNMMLIYFRLNVIAQIFSPIIPYIKRAAQFSNIR